MRERQQGREIVDYYLDVAADGWTVVCPILEVAAGFLLLAVLIPLFLIGLLVRVVVWAATRIPQWVFNLFLDFLTWHAHVILADEVTDEITELANGNGRQTSLSDFE